MEHVFQPLWKFDSWDIYGYEALLRISDESQNLNIEYVLDLVREDGGLYELDTTSVTMAINRFPFDQFHSELLFINIFPSTMLHESFESFIKDLLICYPQARGKIVFEINETKHEEHRWETSKLEEKINFLKEHHFYVAFDDVGKGSATLQKVIEFSPHIIKLDRYFAHELSKSKEKQEMISLLIEYTKQEKILILEGIEEATDLAKAIALGVPVGQGYLLGRPGRLDHQVLYKKIRTFTSGI